MFAMHKCDRFLLAFFIHFYQTMNSPNAIDPVIRSLFILILNNMTKVMYFLWHIEEEGHVSFIIIRYERVEH